MSARNDIQVKRFLTELAAVDIAQAQIAQPMNGGGGYRLGTITRTNRSNPGAMSGDAAVYGSGDLMQRRIRKLYNDSSTVKRPIDLFRDLIVGTGINAFSDPIDFFIEQTAIIPVFGVIRPRADFWTRYFDANACEDLQCDFLAAIADQSINKVVFLADSPGGSVFQLAETSKLIFDNRGVFQTESHTIGRTSARAKRHIKFSLF